MGKKAYVGVSNKARTVKNIYVGVGGKARKVVKGYVGVNGVARQFWPSIDGWKTIFKDGVFVDTWPMLVRGITSIADYDDTYNDNPDSWKYTMWRTTYGYQTGGFREFLTTPIFMWNKLYVRAWLNNEFYNTAFTELQREIILTTTVDNSVYSTGYDSNRYACENTKDKIFLLSHREATNSAYGFAASGIYDTARKMKTSDYSRAAGVFMDMSGLSFGNGSWWLRSPDFRNDGSTARGVASLGTADAYDSVNGTGRGVVPALWIRL